MNAKAHKRKPQRADSKRRSGRTYKLFRSLGRLTQNSARGAIFFRERAVLGDSVSLHTGMPAMVAWNVVKTLQVKYRNIYFVLMLNRSSVVMFTMQNNRSFYRPLHRPQMITVWSLIRVQQFFEHRQFSNCRRSMLGKISAELHRHTSIIHA